MEKSYLNFIPIDDFDDPLNHPRKTVNYSDKFIQNSIFNDLNRKKERELSAKRHTIVFDLDGTLRDWDSTHNEGVLRDYIKLLLHALLDSGYRLIIWSAANRPSIQQTINKYPEFSQYFDKIISAENYSFQFLNRNEQQEIRKIDPQYFTSLTKESKSGIDQKTGLPYPHYRPPKNISLFNYILLVENDRRALQEAKSYHFDCILSNSKFYFNRKNDDITEMPVFPYQPHIPQTIAEKMLNKILFILGDKAPKSDLGNFINQFIQTHHVTESK